MEMKSVAVLGAGAVGSYIIQGLVNKPGIALGVVATGERAKRLGQGCKINNEIYHPQVWSPKEAHNVDLLVIALKYGALAGALEDIKTIAGENTTDERCGQRGHNSFCYWSGKGSLFSYQNSFPQGAGRICI